MMKKIQLVLLIATTFIASSCANQRAIFRKTEINKNEALVLDAKQRLITNTSRESDGRYNKPNKIVCPEPSPDVASGISDALTASLKATTSDGSSGSANLGYASAESIAQLGQRLATTQLLRDELSDLCRSYANGAISQTNYTLRLSQLDEKMVTLLTAEMIAGAFKRDNVLISGSTAFVGGADDSPSQTDLTAARSEIETKENALADAQGELDKHAAEKPTITPVPEDATDSQRTQTTESNKRSERIWQARLNTLQTKVDNASRALDRARSNYASLQMNGGGPQLTPVAGASIYGGQSTRRFGTPELTAEHLVTLQQNYLERDKMSGIVDTCLTRLNDGLESTTSKETQKTTSEEINKLRKELSEKSVELESIIYEISEIERNILSSKFPNFDPYSEGADINILNDFDSTASTATSTKRSQANTLYVEIDIIEREIIELQSKINYFDSGFGMYCGSLLEDISKQLTSSQNIRLQLKLKELEADVQKAAMKARIAQYQLCSQSVSAGADQNQKDKAISTCLNNISSQGTFLGDFNWNALINGDTTPEH